MKQQMMFVSDDDECVSACEGRVIQYEATQELADKILGDYFNHGQVEFTGIDELVNFMLREKELLLRVLK